MIEDEENNDDVKQFIAMHYNGQHSMIEAMPFYHIPNIN